MFEKKEASKFLEKVTDPNTGETVHRYTIPPEVLKNIQESMNKHSKDMNLFVQNSAVYFDMLNFQLEQAKKVKKADQDIKEAMIKGVKDCKLDQKLPWRFNMVLRCWEYCTAPVVTGMSPAEVKASTNPTNKPEIIDAGGVGVS